MSSVSDINMNLLKSLMLEYQESLDNEHKDEYYGTKANMWLDTYVDFLGWLERKYFKEMNICCPFCHKPVIERVCKANFSNDTCKNGHVYPSHLSRSETNENEKTVKEVQ